MPFHSHVVPGVADALSTPGLTSAGGTYHVGGWLVSSTRQARLDRATSTSAARTSTVWSLRTSAGGRG